MIGSFDGIDLIGGGGGQVFENDVDVFLKDDRLSG